MQYQVPQFIDIEDKIIGPLTLKQFGWLAGGGVLVMAAFFLLKLGFAILVSTPVVFMSVAFTFVKVQGMPLSRYLGSMAGFAFKPQEYRWGRKR